MITNRMRALALTGLVLVAGVSSAAPVAFQMGTATFSQTLTHNWTPAEMIDGVTAGNNGWAIYDTATATTSAQTVAFETVSDLTSSALSMQLDFNYGTQHLLGRFRVSVTSDDRGDFADGLIQGGDVTANWTVLTPTSVTVPGGLTSSVLGDGSVLVGDTVPATGSYTVDFNTPVSNVTGLRLEVLLDPSLPTDGPGLQPSNGNFVISEMTVNAVPEPATMVVLGLAALAALRRARA